MTCRSLINENARYPEIILIFESSKKRIILTDIQRNILKRKLIYEIHKYTHQKFGYSVELTILVLPGCIRIKMVLKSAAFSLILLAGCHNHSALNKIEIETIMKQFSSEVKPLIENTIKAQLYSNNNVELVSEPVINIPKNNFFIDEIQSILSKHPKPVDIAAKPQGFIFNFNDTVNINIIYIDPENTLFEEQKTKTQIKETIDKTLNLESDIKVSKWLYHILVEISAPLSLILQGFYRWQDKKDKSNREVNILLEEIIATNRKLIELAKQALGTKNARFKNLNISMDIEKVDTEKSITYLQRQTKKKMEKEVEESDRVIAKAFSNANVNKKT